MKKTLWPMPSQAAKSITLWRRSPSPAMINEMKYVVERWRMDYNHYRLDSRLDYKTPAAFAAMCLEHGSGSLRLTQDRESRCEILS